MAYEKLSLNGLVAVVVGGITGIGRAGERVGAGMALASESASVVNGELLSVDERLSASGVNP